MKKLFFKTIALGLVLLVTGVNAYHAAPAWEPIINAKEIKSTKKRLAMIDRLEYDFATAAIRHDYYQDLDQLASTIVNEKYAISLRGHADSIGNYVANWKLSDKRALEVKEYLIQKGVDEKRIVTTPYGSTEPIATNKTPEGRQKNRRVEVKLRKLND